MYEKLYITENHLQVLSLFTNGFDREYYIREVHKLLKICPRTAQLILEDLEKKAVLESKTRGKIRVYKIKKGMTAKQYLILTEIYKRISFLGKNLIIKEIVEKITPAIERTGIIFGSFVKGTQKEDSDLDLFIVGDYNKKIIEKASTLYDIDISIKNYPVEVFEKNIRDDILLKEIFENHIVITGADYFVNNVVK